MSKRNPIINMLPVCVYHGALTHELVKEDKCTFHRMRVIMAVFTKNFEKENVLPTL